MSAAGLETELNPMQEGDDMPSVDEPHPLCWFCRKKPATELYIQPKSTKRVCATCLDRLQVQDAYEHAWLHFLVLEDEERYEEVLAGIGAFLEANRHRDHDQWLARSITRDRSSVLFEAGRYPEADEACDAWGRFPFDNVTDRWFHGSVKAQIVQALGRPQEALSIFEEAFSHQDPRYASAIPYYLHWLVDFSDAVGQPVDEKWRCVAEAGAEDFAVEMPVRGSLGESMLALAEMTREMPSKRQREWEAKHGGGTSEGEP
ncbi:hypothetical protein [Polyangium sorediatum]|uniref:Tetratricopeptide repeat protein n=1 Tax=Polyangium sorediatum TaxID=889274 RepID=A0ABT6NTU7_9BACT|nr:hypothetical protein [Polyangium sorediatum]MDI1431749.1 hypothetical protein [Polyangium sorediatum]